MDNRQKQTVCYTESRSVTMVQYGSYRTGKRDFKEN